MTVIVRFNLLPAYIAGLPAKVQTVVNNEADRVAQGAKDLMTVHYPPSSSPGDPPAIRTGEYRDGIAAQHDTAPLGAEVTFPEPGLYLEMGTSRMAARPVAIPAVEASIPAFEAEAAAIIGAI